jgi:hypothetical protein
MYNFEAEYCNFRATGDVGEGDFMRKRLVTKSWPRALNMAMSFENEYNTLTHLYRSERIDALDPEVMTCQQ